MKKVKILALFIAFASAGNVVKAQNCNSFPTGAVCANETPGGQQAKCCSCVGTESQNQAFCNTIVPINSGIVFLGIAGLSLGAVLVRKRLMPVT